MRISKTDLKVATEKKYIVILQTIGNNFCTLRKSRNETLKTVAKAVRTSPGHLSKVEKGLAPFVRVTLLGMLCKYYDVKMYDILSKEFKLIIKAVRKNDVNK